MPRPRKSQVCLEATPYYHCVSRCVRRAFLCGVDHYSSHSYEHRRQWVEDRLLELSRWFAIDLCAYAVMSNHCHVVLHVDTAQAKAWTTLNVVERWHGIFAGNLLSQRFLAGHSLCDAERRAVEDQAEVWRENLMSVSWFMRCLNEHIARQANAEDGCTGRFWEGRFKCQALLDEAALLACMAYVDLNPVRAGIAETPETSVHTSIHNRICIMLDDSTVSQPADLLPFVGNHRKAMPEGLAFHLQEYLALVDWTGQAIRDDKRGAISAKLPPILERLQIEEEAWLSLTTSFETLFASLVGREMAVQAACQQLGKRWSQGISACRRCFPT
jgi:REP element-mobilizing transposase RayT